MAYRKNPTDRDQSALENQAASSGIRFPWFNGATGKGQIKTIPAYDLQANGNAGGVSNNAMRFPGGGMGASDSVLEVVKSVYPILSGVVTNVVGGIPMVGVTVTVVGTSPGGSQVTTVLTTDGSGRYSTTLDQGWSGTVVASKTGYSLAPAPLTLSNVISNVVGNFVATSTVVLFFNDTQLIPDYSWNTVVNWWMDSSWTIPAGRLPAYGESVCIDCQTLIGPVSVVTLLAVNVGIINDANYGISGLGNVHAPFTFHDILGLGLGNCPFNAGIINGNCAFSPNTTYGNNRNAGTVNGNCYFYAQAGNDGIIVGNVFSNTLGAIIGGTITGNCEFLENENAGAIQADITGNCDFYGYASYLTGHTITGNVTFHDNATNAGTIHGNADVYSPAPNPIGGSVSGTTTYHGY